MARWELLRDVFQQAHANGREWLSSAEIVRANQQIEPDASYMAIRATISAYCINDPSKKHYPGHMYLRNPQFITDDPTMRGKRFRLLTDGERAAFLASPREDLEAISYSQVEEWLGDPTIEIEPAELEIELEGGPDDVVSDLVSGTALLELHLQDYLHRHWMKIFPQFTLYQGSAGREFRTYDPSVGILDFLCTDVQGNFVIVETKRNLPDRQAVGQTLGYMGWVKHKLATSGQEVRGILVASEVSDQLRMAAAAAPALSLYIYEISFDVRPA
jgi:hypothetical protein